VTTLLQKPAFRAALIYAAFVLAAVAIILLLQPVMVPLIISFILYAVLQPGINHLVSHGISSSMAVGGVLILLVIVIVTALVLLFPHMVVQLSDLQERLPVVWEKISGLLTQATAQLRQSFGVTVDAEKLLRTRISTAETWGSDFLISTAGTIMQIAMTLLLVPLISFFLLRDYRAMRNRVMSWLPNRSFELAWLIYYRVARQLQNYLRGIMVQSGIIALIAGTGFWISGIEMPLLFGALTGLLNLIPYVGPVLALVPPLFVTLGAPEASVIQIIGIVITIGIAQIIDNLFVVPAVIAGTVDLHPLAVLFGIVIFGYLFGFIGMLAAIPVMSASKIIFLGLFYGLQGYAPPTVAPHESS